MVRSRSSLALVGLLALGLGVSGCARHNADSDLAAGARAPQARATPPPDPAACRSSARRVGDRVFFDTDQTDLSPAAQATLDKQAAWLNQYNRYTFTIEGHADERGTREYNFALGARRAPGGARLSRGQGRLDVANEDDQLRQGAAGRRLRRHFVLVAEPPRRHRAERRAGKLTR